MTTLRPAESAAPRCRPATAAELRSRAWNWITYGPPAGQQVGLRLLAMLDAAEAGEGRAISRVRWLLAGFVIDEDDVQFQIRDGESAR
jgi:hypothetical protein